MVVNRQLALEGEYGCGNQRLSLEHAGIVDEVARREIVGAVGNDVVFTDNFPRVIATQRAGMFLDGDMRVQVAEPLGAARELGLADLAAAEEDLAMQVRSVHGVEFDDTDPADACRRQVHRQR